MRFKTIWTLRGMRLGERLRRTGSWAALKIAHRLPQRFAYWVLIDQGVRHMGRNEVVPEVTFMDVLKRAGGPE